MPTKGSHLLNGFRRSFIRVCSIDLIDTVGGGRSKNEAAREDFKTSDLMLRFKMSSRLNDDEVGSWR